MQPSVPQSPDNPILGSTQDAGGEYIVRSSRSSVASNSSRSEGRNNPRRSSPHYVGAGRKVERASLSRKLRQKGYRHNSQVNDYRDTRGEKTQLMLSGQPTGWAAMAHAAGLFGSIDAFLIESYQNLLEDPATQSLSFSGRSPYRRLVITCRLECSTALHLLSLGRRFNPPQPTYGSMFFGSRACYSAWSLLLRYTVKQWLREFLAAENPHLRLDSVASLTLSRLSNGSVRDRAVLPLLLQLALALFFAGLCFFTASVHASVEYTTLPLVLGWTFCFCTVTVLPLFHPRCPYRTALLKTGVQSVHRFIGRVAKAASVTCRTILSHSPRGSQRRLKERLLAKVEKPLTRWSAFLADQDEARMMTHTEKDIEILGTVDSIQSDDELLNTAIAEAMDTLIARRNSSYGLYW
ncbi:hypothetical protein BC629DRAFT_1593316 [Irpex lacteus]|nr:hypothetical protein BC629DRAFT_1593316 [Irpex lacteus]